MDQITQEIVNKARAGELVIAPAIIQRAEAGEVKLGTLEFSDRGRQVLRDAYSRQEADLAAGDLSDEDASTLCQSLGRLHGDILHADYFTKGIIICVSEVSSPDVAFVRQPS